MGGLSIWHWLIALVILGVPAAVLAVIIWLVVRLSKRPIPAAQAVTLATPISQPPLHSATELRLQELSALRSKGLITDSEYEQQRSAILSSV